MKAETNTNEKSAGPGKDSSKEQSREATKQQIKEPIKDVSPNSNNMNKELSKAPTLKSDPLDKLKKEDLIQKIKEYEEKMKSDKEATKKLIDAKNKDIENKDKVIFSISGSNKKLINELDDLRREVDEKLDKVGVKQLKEIEKEKEKERKRQPLEHVLKVKEKELKNALTLLEVFKKDKENLQKNLNEKCDFQKVVQLQDKLKEEEMKVTNLESEIRSLNKMKEEHNKCEAQKEEMNNERKQIVTEVKYLKEKNKDLLKKIKEEEEKNEKMNKILIESKIKINQNPQNSVANLNLGNPVGTILPNINKENPRSNNMQKYWNMLESADKMHDDTALKKVSSEKKDLNKEKLKFSVSLQNKNFRIAESVDSRPKLFGMEEKKIIAKLLPSAEISKLEKRFESIDVCKLALEKKLYTETKSLNKKITDLEERLEMATLQNKEIEQKNKILTFQINEHKNENRILSKKIVEMNSNMKNLNRALRDREEENKKLILQMSEVRKHEENYDETEQQEEMMEEDAMDTQDHRHEDDRMEGEPMEGQEIEDM
jgi:hypothetical protein